MSEITFYFDYISNNAYLAWTQIFKLADKHGLKVKPVPVLFAGLLNANNSIGPAEIPAKRRWMAKNILRKSGRLGITMNPPIHHPFNPLLALRASALPMPAETQRQFIDLIFKAVWVDRLHVSEPDVISALAEQAGLNGAEIVKQAQAEAASKRLRHDTQVATEKGSFGIPTMLINKELFFGYDDFEFMESYLTGNDPVKLANLEDWQQTQSPASAARRRK